MSSDGAMPTAAAAKVTRTWWWSSRSSSYAADRVIVRRACQSAVVNVRVGGVAVTPGIDGCAAATTSAAGARIRRGEEVAQRGWSERGTAWGRAP
jgi:hypothetical protein